MGYNAKPQVDIQTDVREMTVILDKYITFSVVLHTVLGIIRWPIGFFTLSEEDRAKAGINMGDEVGDIELAYRKEHNDEKI